MGGNGSGRHRGDNPNGGLITEIDEARWRLIAARDNQKVCMDRLGLAYHAVKAAHLEVTEAIDDLARLQQFLGDKDLTNREIERIEELTVSHPTRLGMMQEAVIAAATEDKQVTSHLKAAVKRATA